jgi:hypothetical protein
MAGNPALFFGTRVSRPFPTLREARMETACGWGLHLLVAPPYSADDFIDGVRSAPLGIS